MVVFESPPSDGDLILIDGLIVTDDEISVNFLVDDLGAAFSYTYFGCGAEDYCRARISWSRGFNPVTNEFAQNVRFSHVGVTQANGSDPDGPDPDDYVFNVSVRQPLPLGSTVIAVASQAVPEPATGCLAAMGLLCLVGFVRRSLR